MPALRAGGGSRPRPLGASLPPPAACGPLPLPTLGGLGAARPARLRRSGLCGGWSPPAAAQVCAPAGLASRQPLRGGTPPQSKAKPPSGRACGAALLCSSPAPVAASVLRRGPAPTLWGLWGRPALENPVAPGLLKHLLIQADRPSHAPGFAGLGFADGLLFCKLRGAQAEDVRNSQTGGHAQLHNEPICGHQGREYMAHLGRGGVAGTGQNAPTLLSLKCLLPVVVKII